MLVLPIPTAELGPPEYENIVGPENTPLLVLVKSTNLLPFPEEVPITNEATSE